MRKLVMCALVVLAGLLGRMPDGQADDAFGHIVNNHRVSDGDKWRNRRDHDLGIDRGGGYNWNNGGHAYRPPAPPKFNNDYNRRDHDRGYGDRDYGGRLIQQNDIYQRNYQLNEQYFKQSGKYRQKYYGKQVTDQVFRDKSRIYESRRRDSYSGGNFYGMGYDNNGYSQRNYRRDNRGIGGGYSAGNYRQFGPRF